MPRRNYMKEWGESGSFRPYLVPDGSSMERLRAIQYELVKQLEPDQPSVKKVEDLHATIFYMKPVEVYKYLREKVNPKLDRNAFYDQLMISASMLLSFHDPSEVEVRAGRIQATGDDHSIAALTLNPGDFDAASLSTRSDVHNILRRSGLTNAMAYEMAQDSRFRWLLGYSIPHISLVTGLRDVPTTLYQPGPLSIRFIPEVGVGSATAGPTDPSERLHWPLRGIPGDPFLEKVGKDPEALLPKGD